MVTLLINLEEKQLQQLLMDASADSISLDEHIKRILTSTADIHTSRKTPSKSILELAINRAKQRSKGDEFILQDLLSDAEWSEISSPTVFGRDFRKSIEPKIADHIGKTPNNKAIYRRQ